MAVSLLGPLPLDGARRWLETALDVAGDDPEVQLYAAQARREGWLAPPPLH